MEETSKTETAARNTDRELWRETHPEGEAFSYYAPSIHVTEGGGIGINVDGFVIVKSLREWHELAFPSAFPDIHERRLRQAGGGSIADAAAGVAHRWLF